MANKRVSAKDKLKKEDLFKSTDDNNKAEHKGVNNTNCKQTNNTNCNQELKRQTYYLEDTMIKALGLKAVLEGRDKSEIVRTALKEYIEANYFELADK